MALMPGDKANFATLERAWKAGRVAIMESRDLATGEYRALLCAMGQEREGDEIYTRPTPLAVMVWNNPYEAYADPTADTLPPAKEPETLGRNGLTSPSDQHKFMLPLTKTEREVLTQVLGGLEPKGLGLAAINRIRNRL